MHLLALQPLFAVSMQAGGAEGGGGEGAGGLGGDNAAVVLSARPAFISKTSTTTSPVAEEAAALTQLSTLRVASRHTCGGIRTFEHICVDHMWGSDYLYRVGCHIGSGRRFGIGLEVQRFRAHKVRLRKLCF